MAAETIQLLETARTRIEEAGPGQTVHISYVQSERTPSDLEPIDPYHLSYAEIWPAQEFIDTWIEIDTDGTISRWRTQLRSVEGTLVQDLLFDNGTETDYFPQEGIAYRFAQETSLYRDDRLVLIEDFLAKDNLSRRANVTPNGQAVLSVYGGLEELGTQDGRLTVSEALVYQNRPFMADLALVSRAVRIDFDRSTLLPVGEAQVGWDEAGVEYIISYKSFLLHEILTPSEAEGVFQQQVPEQAFQD